MQGYNTSLQRIFDVEWGYKLPSLNEKRNVFGNDERELWTAMGNLFWKQQEVGMVRKSQNGLSNDDIKTLYSSPKISESAPWSFQCRLMLDVAIMTSIWSMELTFLNELHRVEYEGSVGIFITKKTYGNVLKECLVSLNLYVRLIV